MELELIDEFCSINWDEFSEDFQLISKLGECTDRQRSLELYREKRKKRNYDFVRYEKRQSVSVNRLRNKGKFLPKLAQLN